MAYVDNRQVCAPWADPEELCCEGAGSIENCADPESPTALVYPFTDADYILAASNILYQRTCYRYPGLCTVQVWPCRKCRCDCHPCRCSGVWSVLEVPTDYPIQSVTDVLIDGVSFPPADYRLDADKWIVRLDGQHWPTCNSFDLPQSGSVEIVVEAVVGREPPIELKMAAIDLACEIKKACNGDESCGLPPHVRSLNRRGITLEIDDVTALFHTGQFGIQSVDMALQIHGNCNETGRLFDPLSNYNKRGYKIS